MSPEANVVSQDAFVDVPVGAFLMGGEVEPRRQFIEENAKYVENLDV